MNRNGSVIVSCRFLVVCFIPSLDTSRPWSSLDIPIFLYIFTHISCSSMVRLVPTGLHSIFNLDYFHRTSSASPPRASVTAEQGTSCLQSFDSCSPGGREYVQCQLPGYAICCQCSKATYTNSDPRLIVRPARLNRVDPALTRVFSMWCTYTYDGGYDVRRIEDHNRVRY